MSSDRIQHKISEIFSIIVENKQTGIKQCDILKVLHERGVSKKRVGSTDYIAMLDNAGYLVWMDKHGKLHPYKNLNNGVCYEKRQRVPATTNTD